MSKSPDVELRPDGWDRFVRAVKIAGKTAPMHREGKPKQSPKTGKPKRTAKQR